MKRLYNKSLKKDVAIPPPRLLAQSLHGVCMPTDSRNIWLPIYEQIHEHLRDTLKRRDQIIAFYLLLLAALISAWDKLGEIQNIIVAVTWVIGFACFIVLTQYWRWQVIFHLSLVTLQNLMAFSKEPSLDECKRIWNTVNKTNLRVWSFLNPLKGVEINVIYLFALMTFVPGYLFYRINGVAILSLNSEIVAFLLDALTYTFFWHFFLRYLSKDFLSLTGVIGCSDGLRHRMIMTGRANLILEAYNESLKRDAAKSRCAT
jgi:hypothetical protein